VGTKQDHGFAYPVKLAPGGFVEVIDMQGGGNWIWLYDRMP